MELSEANNQRIKLNTMTIGLILFFYSLFFPPQAAQVALAVESQEKTLFTTQPWLIRYIFFALPGLLILGLLFLAFRNLTSSDKPDRPFGLLRWARAHRCLIQNLLTGLVVLYILFWLSCFIGLNSLFRISGIVLSDAPFSEKTALIRCLATVPEKWYGSIIYSPRGACFARVLQKYEDPKICQLLFISNDYCLAEQAMLQDKPELCELALDTIGVAVCYSEVATYYNDPSICDKIPAETAHFSVLQNRCRTKTSIEFDPLGSFLESVMWQPD